MAGGAAYDPEVANLSLGQRLKKFNGMLVFIMIHMAFCAFNYGFDVGTFGGVQATHAFASRFGQCDAQDVCALPGWLSSVLTATPFFGKALGCIAAGPIAERYGRKAAILALCILSFVGVTLQVATINSAAQFGVGRIVTYGMTGMAIVIVPIYQAETCPRELRGMFASTIQLMIVFGQVVSTLITYGTKNIDSSAAWRIPIGLQLAAPALIVVLLPFIPESPRWLLARGRREDAAKNLKKLRKHATEDDVQTEIEGLLYAHAHEDKGTWAEVFGPANRVRTGIAIYAMLGQQITGQAFPSQYGVIFYQQQGFGDRAFLFNIISNVIGLVAVILTCLYVDRFGRRVVLMLGGFLMGAWLLVLGGVSTVPHDSVTETQKGVLVASIMLFTFFFNFSWAPVSYVVVSEVATQRLKEKTNLLACVISVLTTFVTSFTVPYLIKPAYANLGGKVGFIYGAINLLVVIGVFFIVPEMKGRTLEEVDQLFASGVSLRKFQSIKTKTATELCLDEMDHKVGATATHEA